MARKFDFPSDYDPRIVDLYDGDNPAGEDHDYYLALADRVDARAILDVGCGTGLLTVALTSPQRKVVGIDPSPNMVAYARGRGGADRVTWIDGEVGAIALSDFDLVSMAGNVAQHIQDPLWEETLGAVRKVTRLGGVLAFESRNPAAREWLGWHQPEPTRRDTLYGPLREWSIVVARTDGLVVAEFFNHFETIDEIVVQTETLTFRTVETLKHQLHKAGFEVVSVWGDWRRSRFDGTQPIMVFEAVAK